MKYFECPSCGFGPVNMTKAILDHKKQCPKCSSSLVEIYDKARKKMAAKQEHLEAAAVTQELHRAADRYLKSHEPRK